MVLTANDIVKLIRGEKVDVGRIDAGDLLELNFNDACDPEMMGIIWGAAANRYDELTSEDEDDRP